jgi:cytochrome d ubiquinol oxidase subunit II
VPLLVGAATLLFARALKRRAEVQPFLLALLIFLLSFVGLGSSIHPRLAPGKVTIFEAATAESSQIFMLFGVGSMLPSMIGYTGHAYWVFRGKVCADGCH